MRGPAPGVARQRHHCRYEVCTILARRPAIMPTGRRDAVWAPGLCGECAPELDSLGKDIAINVVRRASGDRYRFPVRV